MTVATIDNASDTELNRTITWQFDNATKLVGIIQSLKDFFTQSTKNFWDGIVPNVEDIDTANDYGLAVWGKILGVNRPSRYSTSEITDNNIYYCKYTGILQKVTGSFPGYTSNKNFYFHNDRFDLVSKLFLGLDTWQLWNAGETQYTDDRDIGQKSYSHITGYPSQIAFPSFTIGGIVYPPESIDGGTTLTHTYPLTDQFLLSSENYRKLLKGRFALLNGNSTLGIVGNGSVDDYCKYVNYIFGGLVTVTDGLDMSLTFTASDSLTGELRDLFDNYKDAAFIYPCGVKDNVLSNSLCFKLTQTNTPDAAFISANHAGSLNNSSFTWN